VADESNDRIKDLDARLGELQKRLESQEALLLRQSDAIQVLQGRLDLAEGQQQRTNTHLVSFQVNQKERSLNPTEKKQIGDLIGARILTAQNQILRTIYVPVVQPPTRHAEPLYAP
jgi:hypothetical protein